MNVITGATGLLGSHLAEQLRAEGRPVRALVRAASRMEYLKTLDVELAVGDLSDVSSLKQAFTGAQAVYHAAAKVGDWGAKSEFARETQVGTRNVVAACLAAGVKRLVHISSTSAYGHPPQDLPPITEEHPLGTKFWLWDDYTRAKIEAEKAVWEAIHSEGLPATIIRPSWLYGPRDRLSIARIERTLRLGRVVIIGDGTNPMNTVYAGNVAEACRLAAASERAIGQAYNITSDGVITQREYFNAYADAFGYPRPTKRAPYWLVFAGAWVIEALARLRRQRKPPFITRYAVWLLGRRTLYSTEKAQRELGWQPRVGYAEGIRRTVEWFRSTGECGPVLPC
jgi:nucleoside-diphosphate-sugar epimerase